MRRDEVWENGGDGTYIKTISPTGYNVLINGTDRYLNFAALVGSSGYGFRDNNGTMEFKNSGGSWASIPSGAIGGSGTANEIAYWVNSTTLGSLAVATYPSLAQLAYVKGVTSAIQTQLDAKQATLVSGTNIKTINSNSLLGSGDITVATLIGYTPEDVANKSTDTSLGSSDTLYPSQKAVKTYVDGLVVGLLDYRGAYDASVNTFPASGGSGAAGAVLKGDMWVISVAGTLGGTAVQIGDSVIANVDTPGQTASNWDVLNGNISYVPENVANKVTSINGSSTDTQYPSAKLTYDQLVLKAAVGQTFYIGTTQVAINRASASLTLAGIVLTTPNIGTPSAGVLTNATGLPVSSGISGLGTGVATALAVNVGSAGAFVTFNGALGTPSSGTLTNATGLPIAGLVASTSTAIGVGTIELGHASDTTISRGAAGFIAVEGNRVPSPGSQAEGDTLYRGATEWARLAKGTALQVLTMNAGATAPEWVTPSAGSSVPTMKFSTLFETAGRFDVLVNGSGAATIPSTDGMPLNTGATGSSSVRVMLGIPYNNTSLYNGSPVFTAHIGCVSLTAASGAGSSFFGICQAVTTDGSGHTYTVRHIGFKIIKASGTVSLYATQADQTTENASAALTTLADLDDLDLILKVNGSTSVDYYFKKNNTALSSATNLTSNMPSITAAAIKLQFSTSNNSTAFAFNFSVPNASYER